MRLFMIRKIYFPAAFAFCLGFFFTLNSLTQESGKPYIVVGPGNIKKSLVALPPFQFVGTPALAKNYLSVGKEIFDTLSNDLSASAFFEFINQSAFLEDTSKVGLRPAPGEPGGFNFSTWKQIGTEFLIRSGYRVIGSEITLETYLYHVPQSKLVFGKTYKSQIKDARYLAHSFANDIVKQLTGNKGFFLTKIVVSRTTSPGQKEIFVMDWDTHDSKAVTQHKSIAISPSWSKDGKQIAYTAFAFHKNENKRNADLFTYELETGKRWLISYRPGINSGSSFMPDGKNILLTLSSGRNPDIYKMSVDGKNLTKITDGPRDTINVEPDASPDGKQLAFSSDRSGRPMIYVSDIEGKNPKRITIMGELNSTPRWSPDGKKIVFAGYDKGHFDLFLMDADGMNPLRLTSAKKPSGKAADNEDPSFSPDGRHILFVSNRTGKNQLYIVTADGQNERRLTFDNHEYFKPKWSPYLD